MPIGLSSEFANNSPSDAHKGETLTFRVLAAADLEIVEAALWYDGQRPNLGDEFVQEVAHAFERIQRDPSLFGYLEGQVGHDEVRRCLLNRFPYIVVYRFRPDETLIVSVSHVRRKPFHWLERMT